MKEQLIEMGFVEGILGYFYQLDNGTLFVSRRNNDVLFLHRYRVDETLATNATIEQISNILKSIQI